MEGDTGNSRGHAGGTEGPLDTSSVTLAAHLGRKATPGSSGGCSLAVTSAVVQGFCAWKPLY